MSNEKLQDRHEVFAANFHSTHTITGDIWKEKLQIERETRQRLQRGELTLLYATPPCQGMSKNGRGKLLSAIRAGVKAPLDERNRLIVPTLDLVVSLRPEILLLENVPEMANTLILDEDGCPVGVLDYIERRLGSEYSGCAEVVEFANYGVPQRRQRLISIYTRNRRLKQWLHDERSFMPAWTHSHDGREGTLPWKTVRDVIGDITPIDASSKALATSAIPFHRVPLLDEMKYWWVENTPPGRSAFDNQCASCGFQGNRGHSARRGNKSRLPRNPRLLQTMWRPTAEADGGSEWET